MFKIFKQKILIPVIVLLLCTSLKLSSQIVASPTAGCAPLTVNFTPPPGATAASWNFGDGGTSVLLSPGHIYLLTGNMNVVCNYTAGGVPGSTTLVVPIFPKPTASFNFNIPPSHCAPMTVTFTSTSPGQITGYQWNFGNGATSTSSNPIYSYPGSGTFNVNLTVVDANGCSGTVTAGPINVSSPPIPVINTNPSPASSCTAPFTCTFSGSNSQSGSPTGGGLTYSWNFPGGSPASSGAANPGAVNYANVGSYQVTLTVTDNNNCSAKNVINVAVSQPTLSSTIPATVCPGKTFTVNFQTNQSASSWIMPGSMAPTSTVVATSSNPVTSFTWQYPTPGTYTIQTGFGNFPCAFTQTKVIVVELITASITANPPTFSCGSPFVCNYFNASSPNANQFSWSVDNCNGLPMTSNAANPTFTYTQGSLNPYTIYPYCVPIVKLIVTNAVTGCTALATIQVDTLRKPTAWFNKSKKEGCAPLTVKFTDTSEAYLGPFESVTGYTWNNGAQPPTIVTGVPPTGTTTTFVYNTAGTYTPFLIIQTAQGCIDTSFVDTVRVVNPAPLSFSFSPGTVCAGQTVQVSASTPSPPIQHWHVKSDLGFFSGCVNDPNPIWKFTHVGVHTFTVEAWKNGCMSSTTTAQTIQVNGPMVKSRFETNCTNRRTVLFDSHVQDAAVGEINFGDATPTVTFACVLGASTQFTINHTYSVTGDYTAAVTATNGVTGCPPYTYTMLVQVRDVQASIALSPTVCSGLNTTFSSATSTDVLVGCPDIGYNWFFDMDPPVVTSLTAVSYSWAAPGVHTVVLMVKDLNSCTDTVTRTIRVSSASPTFAAMPSNTICLSTGTVQFVNNTLDTPDPITNASWSFGNNTFSSNISNTIDPIGHYTAFLTPPGATFAVILTATNALGCIATTSMVMNVNNPSAQLSAQPNNFICTNQTVAINAPPGYATYSLSLGDGSVAVTSNSSTIYSYPIANVYTLTIEVTDNFGCRNSSTMSIDVQSYPTASFNIVSINSTDPNVACLGNNITFSSVSTSSPTYNLTYNWDIGNGANILPLPVVAANYTSTGVFPVKLTVSTPNGCSNTFTRTVTVLGVKGKLELDKSTICLGEAITFKIKGDSSTVFGWQWDFGDGITTSTLLASPPPSPTISHTYATQTGIKTVKLVCYSTQFKCNDTSSYPISILKAEADFKRNSELLRMDSVHCLGQTDQFTSLAAGNYQYNWSFGDGNSSTQQSPSYNYPVPGIYTVALSVTLQPQGCLGSIAKTMTINPLPSPSVSIRDTCQGRIFPLNGSGPANLVSYTWSPQAGVTNPNALITTATASTSTIYTLNVIDVNGCKGAATQSVYIQEPPDNIEWDTTIVIGQQVPINASAGTNLSYTWMPNTDLSCQYCADPVSTSTNNITYSVTVADNLGCFSTVNTYTIRVDPKSTIDVPTAFTPNGDGTNDVIRPDGWGIKKLNYFRIYNRWGQLLFESNDIKNGWDGTYNGVPQNMETYVYQVSAVGFIEGQAELLLTGSFKLLR